MSTRLVKLFEDLAKATWDRIQLGYEFNCKQSEETITDINLLEMARAKLQELRVVKITKKQEAKYGFDWEWWVGSSKHEHEWVRFSIQAKKLSLDTGSYKSLRTCVTKKADAGSGTQVCQFDVLHDFARANGTIPLYCFYNALTLNDLTKYWHCSEKLDPKQLGCTLVPIEDVRDAHKRYARKSFQKLHEKSSAIPWRCLFKDPKNHVWNNSIPNDNLIRPQHKVETFSSLPGFISDARERGSLEELPPEYYDSDLGGLPSRIAVIDTSELRSNER